MASGITLTVGALTEGTPGLYPSDTLYPADTLYAAGGSLTVTVGPIAARTLTGRLEPA